MDGWKPVERSIESPVLLDQAVDAAVGMGFTVRERHPGHVLLARAGTQIAFRGDKFPLDLALAESEQGIFLQLRYDTFALFDTGDLEDLADRMVTQIATLETATDG